MTEKLPYEFLARWKDGKLSGSHIQFVERTTVEGVVIAERVLNPQPVGSAEFPLSDILDTVSSDALAALTEATTAKESAESKLAAVESEHASVVAAIKSGDAEALAAKAAELSQSETDKAAEEKAKRISQLQAELAALENP